MKLETVKSFILIILVGVSLLLTLGLWSFSPSYKHLNNTSYVSEVDLGGKDETKRDLIEPSTIVFKTGTDYLGFRDPRNREALYKDLQSWPLSNFEEGVAERKSKDTYQMELIYPDAVPMEIARDLFTFSEDVLLPGWSFERISIKFDQATSAVEFCFTSEDGAFQATAVIKDTNKYNILWSYFSNERDLVSYTYFDKGNVPIYIPTNNVNMARWSLTVSSIEPTKIVNALFSNPSLVSRNIGEAYYTDGQRGMRVTKDGRAMEFINPIQSKEAMSPIDLLNSSIDNINGHKGWTEDYKLVEIDLIKSTVQFKMYYKGFPIFNDQGLATIEQQWLNQELYKYRRPLFILNNSFGDDSIQLPAGSEIIAALEQSSHYNLEDISDIRIGYLLKYQENAVYNIILEPTWYIKHSGVWSELKLAELITEEGAD